MDGVVNLDYNFSPIARVIESSHMTILGGLLIHPWSLSNIMHKDQVMNTKKKTKPQRPQIPEHTCDFLELTCRTRVMHILVIVFKCSYA